MTKKNGPEYRNAWERDDYDPSSGKAYSGEQAVLAMRWETRGLCTELSRRANLSLNAAMVAAELWSEAKGKGRWTSYSRSDPPYRRNRCSKLFTKRRVCGGVDELERRGLIEHIRRQPYDFGWQFCARARPELVALVQSVVDGGSRPYPVKPVCTVVLRDKDRMPKKFRHTAETRRMERESKLINVAIMKADISGGYAACLRRIFHGSFARGGRFYAIGGAWQVIFGEERALITINGRKTIELDYGSFHATMLYRQAEISPPRDSYDLPAWPRDVVKTAFLIIVNAKDRAEAIHSLAANDEIAVLAVPGSEAAVSIADEICRDVEARHLMIADAFYTDSGADLMRTDSDMAAEIMLEVVRAGFVVLPVHDSFIVEEAAEGVLRTAMEGAAARAGMAGIAVRKSTPKDDSGVVVSH